MSGFTRFGSLTYDWEPLYQLELAPRYLWMGLYMCSPAKRLVPGLFHGSVLLMAEAIRRPVDETANALDALIEYNLVEYDPKTRVLRMTQLPDAGEWPSNPAILDSWFKRFTGIPDCGVRNAHVTVLRWMLERGAAEADKSKNGGKPSVKHEEVWARTFGTISVPSSRRRGVRRLADHNDTSTDVQPGLFTNPEPSAAVGGSLDPLQRSLPVDKSDSVSALQVTEKTPAERLSQSLPRGSGEGEGDGEGEFSFSSSGEGGSGGGHATGKPTLVLLPPPGPFTVAELAQVFAGPRWPKKLDETTQLALARAIGALPPHGGEATLALLGEFVARGGGRFAGISPEQLAAPGVLAAAIQEAIALRRDSEAKAAALREAREQLGY